MPPRIESGIRLTNEGSEGEKGVADSSSRGGERPAQPVGNPCVEQWLGIERRIESRIDGHTETFEERGIGSAQQGVPVPWDNHRLSYAERLIDRPELRVIGDLSRTEHAGHGREERVGKYRAKGGVGRVAG